MARSSFLASKISSTCCMARQELITERTRVRSRKRGVHAECDRRFPLWSALIVRREVFASCRQTDWSLEPASLVISSSFHQFCGCLVVTKVPNKTTISSVCKISTESWTLSNRRLSVLHYNDRYAVKSMPHRNTKCLYTFIYSLLSSSASILHSSQIFSQPKERATCEVWSRWTSTAAATRRAPSLRASTRVRACGRVSLPFSISSTFSLPILPAVDTPSSSQTEQLLHELERKFLGAKSELAVAEAEKQALAADKRLARAYPSPLAHYGRLPVGG